MSDRNLGGFITRTPPVPANSFVTTPAPGVWTLDQAAQLLQGGTWPSVGVNAIETVFSTWLYTGTGGAQTITNGIDLSGQGGLVWIKNRTSTSNNLLLDTNRGSGFALFSNLTNGNGTGWNWSANSNGFSVAVGGGANGGWNSSGNNYASWTFRKAPKFFDIVTYTGNGTTQNIAHSLGVEPGMIIVKSTSYADDWTVYHRSLGASFRLFLNATNAATNTFSAEGWGNNTTTVAPTATQFTIGDFGNLNTNGATYVAYLFAHDTSSTGIIQCGSYTGNGSTSGPIINLGWEPQWVLVKNAGGTGNWWIFDNMRGVATGGVDEILWANTTNSSDSTADILSFNATGFQLTSTNGNVNTSSNSYIYVAIRRGPMQVPTVGTSVFNTNFASGGPPNFVPNFVVDLGVSKNKTSSTLGFRWASRLTSQGAGAYLTSSDTTAEATNAPYGVFGSNTGWYGTSALTSSDFFSYSFRRAPSFFDVVCYTGTGAAQSVSHNLGVAPELIIHKSRSADVNSGWPCYAAPLGPSQVVRLNRTDATGGSSGWNDQTPTATQFFVNGYNNSGVTYVAYLFASAPGVSKVGSYTGTGALQTINCGFTTGARFVMIKRTDSTGDWFVWDSARGITSGNDPYLLMNSTAAEVTGTNYVDTTSVGFQVTAAAPAGLNASGGTYIFLAVA